MKSKLQGLDNCQHGTIARTCTTCKPQHTLTPNELYETPWHITYDDADGFYSLRSYTGQRIAKIITPDVELPSMIRRAVNAHDELLELVKEWVSHRAPVKDVPPGTFMDRALKAIAKAEGR